MKIPDLAPLAQRRMALEIRHDESRRQYETLHANVVKHQARVVWQPEVKEVLNQLQVREHERTVGAYEQLLTALLNDVLPGDRQVVMDLHTLGGLPALNIYLRKDKSPREDLFEGTGGSVTNVVSAGLRAISLLRSGKRRFLVLDEADCWIRPEWAPNFAKVIQQMAVELGVQVLMISHHDEDLFPMIHHRLYLEKHAQGLAATWALDSDIPTWEEGQQGIRSITLEDFQAHKLTHLPLGPAVTLLCGDNDIGKSSIVTALRSVFLGEANDTVIRHYQSGARVTLDFGPEHVLRWERHRKGKIKESYCYYKSEAGPDNPIYETHGARAIPDWLEPTLGIGLIDGLDVQIGHQKSPVFLLDKPRTIQAKALAIGQDAGHVQAMMAIDKQETAEAKAAIKSGERELERLSRMIQVSGTIIARKGEWERIQSEHVQLIERTQAGERRQELSLKWRRALDRARITDALEQPFHATPPVLKENPATSNLAARWRRAHATLKATDGLATPFASPPPPIKAPPLKLLQARWKRALARDLAGQTIVGTPAPELVLPHPTHEWKNLARRWEKALQQSVALRLLDENSALPRNPVSSNGKREALVELQNRWTQCQRAQEKLSLELERIRGQEREVSHNSATCPQCGQEWSPAG